MPLVVLVLAVASAGAGELSGGGGDCASAPATLQVDSLSSLLSSLSLSSFAANEPSLVQRSDSLVVDLAKLADDEFADLLQGLALTKFKRALLELDGSPFGAHFDRARHVVAAVVAADPRENCLRLLSLASGSKTVFGEHLSRDGDALSDSHAEVLARRGLVRYLLAELRRLCASASASASASADANAAAASPLASLLEKDAAAKKDAPFAYRLAAGASA